MKEGEEFPIVISHTQALVKQELFNSARDLGHSRVLVFDGAGAETEERSFGIPGFKGTVGTEHRT